ncbi:MAG: hypothetical protein AB2610_20835, partial [Candidatus Thiodiazotropha sp.]
FYLARELTRSMLLSFRAALKMDGFWYSDKCTDCKPKSLLVESGNSISGGGEVFVDQEVRLVLSRDGSVA